MNYTVQRGAYNLVENVRGFDPGFDFYLVVDTLEQFCPPVMPSAEFPTA